MTTDEIRKKFLDFFKEKKHAIVESDSLVPKDDPTVLFTTAGMQQFKRQFLGHIDEFRRAATSQKCLRTDDLDVVGKTNFHHTFFEMLGNFSFGDYFKKEAIFWAWEFFTEELKIPVDKLWVSVYKDDKEAEEIWKNDIKDFDNNKLIKLGDHDNFWPADAKEKGPNGPCGPCSEIFYDYGPNKNCKKKKCDPSCDCGRFSEVWNLVFTQFNRKDGGMLEPLPSKNIDTGMGLERLAAVMQDKKSNFDIDIFVPIFEGIKKHVDPKGQMKREEQCLIADHIRAVVFGISDGVVPSNEGRGYVVKKLINSVTEIAILTGNEKPVIHKLVSAVVQAMEKPYPELKKKKKEIEEIIQNIEKGYIKGRKEYLPKFIAEYKNASSTDDKARILWTYYDTHGLGLVTMNAATIIDDAEINKFENLKKEQQDRSRASSKMGGDVFAGEQLDLGVPKTKFIGYDQPRSKSTVLKLFIGAERVNEVKKGDEVKIILDKTSFYAEAGGQIGDTGTITKGETQIKVSDTQKIEDIYIHFGKVTKGSLKVNDQVDAQIDIERRKAITRNHTATHLLQAALKKVLGAHIKQQGSLVAEDRLRFDFTHPKAIKSDELERVEKQVNEMILADAPVTKEYLDIEEARKSGALAFFAEKYGKTVRVVSINEYSKEFCGGAHVNSTKEIDTFKIFRESAIAQGTRRIEAVTGSVARELIQAQEKLIQDISAKAKEPTLKADEIEALIAKLNEAKAKIPASQMNLVDRLLAELNEKNKKLKKVLFDGIKRSVDDILKNAEPINETKLICHSFQEQKMDKDSMRKVSDLLKQKAKSSIIVLGSKNGHNASILVSVSDDLIKKGIKANEIIQDVAPLINGRGGGQPQLAQAGSKETTKVDFALKEASKIIKEKVKQ